MHISQFVYPIQILLNNLRVWASLLQYNTYLYNCGISKYSYGKPERDVSIKNCKLRKV